MSKAKDGKFDHLTPFLGASLLAVVAATVSESRAATQFASYQTHSHFTIDADPGVRYSVEKIVEHGKLAGLRLVMTGSSEGSSPFHPAPDARALSIRKVNLPQNPGAVAYEIRFTPEARKSGVEYFDYRDKNASQIAIDFWTKSAAMAAAIPPASKGRGPAAAKPKHLALSRTDRTEKGARAPELLGCGRKLDLDKDGAVYFSVYHQSYDYESRLHMRAGDEYYAYPYWPLAKAKIERLGPKEKEIAHYRLALKLRQESQLALALRTIDFFNTTYPESELKAELEFLKANILFELSERLRAPRFAEQSLELYRKISIEQPDTVRGRMALAYLIQDSLGKGSKLQVLELASRAVASKPMPNEPAAREFEARRGTYRLLAAETTQLLGENQRAETDYQKLVEERSPLAAEAALRLGETYMARGFWERAALAFESAISAFPERANGLSSPWLNLGECYYRMGHFDRATQYFAAFERRFSRDPNSWVARFRLAELEQLQLKNDDAARSRSIQASYESVVNRDPYSPGAFFAELRLAECVKDTRENDSNRVFFTTFFARRDLKPAEHPLVSSAQVETWFDLASARFHADNGMHEQALKKADEYRPRMPTLSLAPSFKMVYGKAIVGLAEELAAEESGASRLLEAVAHWGDFAPNPAPFGYELAVARALLARGDLKSSGSVLSKLEGRLSEATSSQRDAYHFAKATTLKLFGENPERSIFELSSISDEGELAAHKYAELAAASLRKSDFRAAVAYDNKLIDSRLVEKLALSEQIEAHIRRAETTGLLRQPELAAKYAERSLLQCGAHTEYSRQILRLKEIYAQNLYDSSNYKDAISAIDDLLAADPKNARRTEFEFMRGKALTSLGREGEAIETFRKLALAPKEDVWKKSAQAELDQIQWENEVSKRMKEKDRRSNQ